MYEKFFRNSTHNHSLNLQEVTISPENLKRYRSKLILWKKRVLLEVIKGCPKPFSTIPLIRENTF